MQLNSTVPALEREMGKKKKNPWDCCRLWWRAQDLARIYNPSMEFPGDVGMMERMEAVVSHR